MSDRALRARSRSRGPSGRSSPQMYDTYAEESFQDGYRAGYQRGCYMDGESRGFLDGYNARRMKKAQGDESDEDSTEEENDSTDEDDDKESRKHEIMDKIWNLAEPGSELEKLVLEYDDASGNTDDEETDTDTEETDSDDEDDDTGKNDNQNNKSNEQN